MPRELITGNRKSSYAERGADLYETPACATLALIKAENLPYLIWEPACGLGAISKILKAHGHSVVCTDLNDYGYEDAETRQDFLMALQAPEGCQAIVTNPPYMLAHQFIRKALELAPVCYMLLRLSFLEGTKRGDVLEGGKLAKVFVFRNRLPMMHRHGYTGKKNESGGMAFAWFKWDREHIGSPSIQFITAIRKPTKKKKNKVEIVNSNQSTLF